MKTGSFRGNSAMRDAKCSFPCAANSSTAQVQTLLCIDCRSARQSVTAWRVFFCLVSPPDLRPGSATCSTPTRARRCAVRCNEPSATILKGGSRQPPRRPPEVRSVLPCASLQSGDLATQFGIDTAGRSTRPQLSVSLIGVASYPVVAKRYSAALSKIVTRRSPRSCAGAFGRLDKT
jgi:hypothetical protein